MRVRSHGAISAGAVLFAGQAQAAFLAVPLNSTDAAQAQPHSETLSLESASALRSIIHDLVGLPLDGIWTNKQNESAVVRGSVVDWTGVRAAAWTLDGVGAKRYSATVGDHTYIGELSGNMLTWSNGDTWVKQSGSTSGSAPDRDEFLERCTEHVKDLVLTLDRGYTHAQLQTLLGSECTLSRQFPETHATKFRTHEACVRFAEELTKVRFNELEKGESADQYTAFCDNYFEHSQAPP
mmetsp:Transcript_71431/g.186235  ORF Transcript_71431/g.186235 Transcript_71431/m.186235 type:complete len:238 (+) Transcript_71431:45-758(+)